MQNRKVCTIFNNLGQKTVDFFKKTNIIIGGCTGKWWMPAYENNQTDKSCEDSSKGYPAARESAFMREPGG